MQRTIWCASRKSELRLAFESFKKVEDMFLRYKIFALYTRPGMGRPNWQAYFYVLYFKNSFYQTRHIYAALSGRARF